MPINILYIIDSLGFGGTERQLIELIRNLDKRRFQPHVCTLRPSTKIFDELDIPKMYLDFISFKHGSIPKIIRLIQFISTHRIQIVQTFWQDPFLLAAMVKPFHRYVKLIGSFRDLGFWRTPSLSWKMRLSYPFYSGFIANSQAVKENFVQVDGILPQKIKVIYNGINVVPPPRELPCKKPDGQQVVGIVANLNRPVKRVQDFVQASALVHQEFPQVRFVVVGDGHLRGELENLAEKLGLGDSIRFIGRIENPLNTISTFDIGVITSETEGFCNATMEYMACGVPVIATAVGGNLEQIEDGINGFLVPKGDCQTLARRLLELLRDRSFAYSIGINGKNSVLNRFSMEKMILGYQDYYETVII